jgi:hypothetical protein
MGPIHSGAPHFQDLAARRYAEEAPQRPLRSLPASDGASIMRTATNPAGGTETRVVDGVVERIGLDPRKMSQADLRALGHEPTSPLAAIRAHCLDCCAGQPGEVRSCIALNCPSWPFRMGTNPWRAPVSQERREAARRSMVKMRAGIAEAFLLSAARLSRHRSPRFHGS